VKWIVWLWLASGPQGSRIGCSDPYVADMTSAISLASLLYNDDCPSPYGTPTTSVFYNFTVLNNCHSVGYNYLRVAPNVVAARGRGKNDALSRYIVPGMGAGYCDGHVCLSVCTPISRTTRAYFTKSSVHAGSEVIAYNYYYYLANTILSENKRV